jgi:hypothetical protein
MERGLASREAYAREMRLKAYGRVACKRCAGSGIVIPRDSSARVCGSCFGRGWHYADHRTAPTGNWFEVPVWKRYCSCQMRGECETCLYRKMKYGRKSEGKKSKSVLDGF